MLLLFVNDRVSSDTGDRETLANDRCYFVPRPLPRYSLSSSVSWLSQQLAALFEKVWSWVSGAKLHQMPEHSPSTPPSVLKQAIKAVPAVKYALGIGGQYKREPCEDEGRTSECALRSRRSLGKQTAPRDTVRIGCTSWSEKSYVAAGRFLLLFSEAGWQIEENKVFRMEPQIPIVGVAIATRTAVDEPKEPLPPHLGRWRLMDESHKTIYWAFHSTDIPVGGATDNTLKEGTLGIYFGSEPQ
jgi:hypothetical protein